MSCKGCTKRHIGCHSHCEDYAEQRRVIKERKEKIHAEKDKERVLNYLDVQRIEWAQKKKGVRK